MRNLIRRLVTTITLVLMLTGVQSLIPAVAEWDENYGLENLSVEQATYANRLLAFMSVAMSEVDGRTVFMDNCGFCHGGDARGIDQLGVDLVDNSFIAGLTDGALKDFIMEGRPEDAPDNITGNMMPAIDYLEDDEYTALMAYLRQINDP